jgi:hypothetical protein
MHLPWPATHYLRSAVATHRFHDLPQGSVRNTELSGSLLITSADTLHYHREERQTQQTSDCSPEPFYAVGRQFESAGAGL